MRRNYGVRIGARAPSPPSGDWDPESLTFGVGGASGAPAIPDGFPDGWSTGLVGAGVSYGDLEAYDGPMTITTPGQVVEGYVVDSSTPFRVSAAAVIVRKCLFLHSGTLSAIRCVQTDTADVLLEDLEVRGPATVGETVIVRDTTVRRCNIFGGPDNLKFGSRTIIEDSYVHDQIWSPGAHADCIQSTGAADVVIRRSTILGRWQASTAAIIWETLHAQLRDSLVEANLFGGGNITWRVNESGPGDSQGPVTNLTVRDNLWLGGKPYKLDAQGQLIPMPGTAQQEGWVDGVDYDSRNSWELNPRGGGNPPWENSAWENNRTSLTGETILPPSIIEV